MKRQFIVSITLYGLAAALLFLAAGITLRYILATNTGDRVPSSQTVTSSTSEPSERTPPPISSPDIYSVDATHPRALTIASINVSSFVQPVGVDQYGQIAVPNNVHFTGWYVKSALPGADGVTIIDGHVGGRYGGAVFTDLANVAIGDEIRLQKGDLSWLTYRIEEEQTITPSDSGALFMVYTDAHSELHLITCEGTYIPSKQSYDKRTLIIARLIE